jgi:hypothetical protein
MELFNAAIKSSQTIGDAYGRTMSVAKSATNDFVYSIANVDFSRFTDGLKGIKQRASEAYDALDQLGNTKISYKYFNAEERAAFASGITSAKDTNLSMEDRRAGLAASKVALENITKMTSSLNMRTEEYLKKEIGRLAGLNASDVEADALARALAIDISQNAEELRANLNAKYDEYLNKLAAANNTYNTKGTTIRGVKYKNENYDPEKYGEVVASIKSEYADIVSSQTLLVRISDEELEALSQKKIEANDYSRSMQELVRQYQEAERALNQPIKPGTVGAALTGEQYAQSFGINYYNTLGNTLAGKAQRGYMPIQDVPIIDENTESSLSYAPVMLDKITESSYTAADGIGALGDAIGSIGGALDEGVGKWANYASGIISSIAHAIPALEALTLAEVAANPWKVATGIAAIASMAAAFAQIPKFSTGGVVPGNSLSSDNVLIRANSGEVVLTKQQANNIGSMLSGGMGGQVVFKIEGSTLVGVLNNHNQIAGRSYGQKNG